MSNKSLSDRMKRYEASYGILIPPRTYTIVRVDGKNFSKFTKRMNKPFDDQFSESMDYAAIELCKYFNPKFAYVQSDEISLVFTDIENIDSEMIFDGKVQKICSLTAAKAATSFNKRMLMFDAANTEDASDFIQALMNGENIYDTVFDSRVFIIPDFREVSNYFVWRQQDCTRNSISMAADAVVGKGSSRGMNGSQKQDAMMEKGVNWNEYAVKYKRGVIISKQPIRVENENAPNRFVMRNKWVIDDATPIFTQKPEYLHDLIPIIQ